MSGYEDIIKLPHHVSAARRHMSRHDRAAQFSPFAALTGYEAVIRESGRLTNRRMELSEDSREVLDRRQRMLQYLLPAGPEITVSYFKPDELKEGGEYVTVTGHVKRLDEFERRIVFENGVSVPMDEVAELRGEVFGDAD